MAYERETIQRIRSEVDRYDKHQLSVEEATIGGPSNIVPRVILCSEVRKSLTVSAYGSILFEDLGIKDFVTPLLNLLQGRAGLNPKFNQVSCWANYHLCITNQSGQNVLLMPSLLPLPRNWQPAEGDIPCYSNMAEQWASV